MGARHGAVTGQGRCRARQLADRRALMRSGGRQLSVPPRAVHHRCRPRRVPVSRRRYHVHGVDRYQCLGPVWTLHDDGLAQRVGQQQRRRRRRVSARRVDPHRCLLILHHLLLRRRQPPRVCRHPDGAEPAQDE